MPPTDPQPAAPSPITDALLAAIRESGLGIGELARAADVSHSLVSRFLSGGTISLTTLDRLAGPLGLALVKPVAARARGGSRRRQA